MLTYIRLLDCVLGTWTQVNVTHAYYAITLRSIVMAVPCVTVYGDTMVYSPRVSLLTGFTLARHKCGGDLHLWGAILMVSS